MIIIVFDPSPYVTTAQNLSWNINDDASPSKAEGPPRSKDEHRFP
jgi:hypothetical protein